MNVLTLISHFFHPQFFFFNPFLSILFIQFFCAFCANKNMCVLWFFIFFSFASERLKGATRQSWSQWFLINEILYSKTWNFFYFYIFRLCQAHSQECMSVDVCWFSAVVAILIYCSRMSCWMENYLKCEWNLPLYTSMNT